MGQELLCTTKIHPESERYKGNPCPKPPEEERGSHHRPRGLGRCQRPQDVSFSALWPSYPCRT